MHSLLTTGQLTPELRQTEPVASDSQSYRGGARLSAAAPRPEPSRTLRHLYACRARLEEAIAALEDAALEDAEPREPEEE